MRRRKDPYLLAPRHEVDGDDTVNIAYTQAFVYEGLLNAYNYEKYRCRHPRCRGFGLLRAGHEGPVQCNVCGEDLAGESFAAVLGTEIVWEGVTAGLIERMRHLGYDASEEAQGHLVAPSRAGRVHVVLVEHCVDNGILKATHPDAERVLLLHGGPLRRARGEPSFPSLTLVEVFEEGQRFEDALRALTSVDPARRFAPTAPPRAPAPKTRSPTATAPPSKAHRPVTARATVELHDASGVRLITEEEAKAVVEDAARFDLLLTPFARQARGATTAYFKDAGGHQRVHLTRSETDVLVEVVLAREQVRLAKLACVARQLGAFDKIYAKARSKVDASDGRGNFAAFKKLGSDDDAIAHFDPPEGYRWAVLVPAPPAT